MAIFQFNATSKSHAIFAGVLRALDIVVVLAAACIAYWVRHDSFDPPSFYLISMILAALLAANYLHLAETYRFENLRRFTVQLGKVSASWFAVVLSLLVLGYFTKTSDLFSRITMALWLTIAWGGFMALRVWVVFQLGQWRRAGKLSDDIVIVGAGRLGQRLAQYLQMRDDGTIRILGFFDDRKTRVPGEVEGHPVLGDVDALLEFVRHHQVSQVIIALPWRAGQHLVELLKKLKTVPIDVKLCSEAIGFDLPSGGFSFVSGVPMLNIFERPLTGWSYVMKLVEDRFLALLFLIAGIPLFLVIAAAIKLGSPGPILFRQKRYGFNNKEIVVYKFRSMYEGPIRGAAVAQARRDDPRVTRFGAFLRRTSLDELPQLVNVLKGEMSLVGPRPHAVIHNEQYAAIIDEYLARHRVKPGITGWAQVNGLRGETETPGKMHQRLQYDLYYIDHWSLLLDFKILFMTLLFGFVNKNAY